MSCFNKVQALKNKILLFLVPRILTVLKHQLILADAPVGLNATITAM